MKRPGRTESVVVPLYGNLEITNFQRVTSILSEYLNTQKWEIHIYFDIAVIASSFEKKKKKKKKYGTAPCHLFILPSSRYDRVESKARKLNLDQTYREL